MKKPLASLLVCALAACGSGDRNTGLQSQAEKASRGEDVELDIVDENADNLSAEQKAELKAWEERQNEEINRRVDEMRDR
ncbi:hypothetical protein [Pseudoblastomonas halimionae]|uniref:Uncharacterized protein n=1 Tax=Alteriqipengyuania halimionae TaxID=1926630 RepID=A0A6I4U3S5_9SPHN|nr:hypothetical protein [Alteriqipengyuania halimionae]MXP08877.1 hypothetical protein [Alteriqipengyuania halimionae]